MPVQPVPLGSKPGVKRDGTRFDSEYHADATWVRWHRGRARKIGGYQRLPQLTGAISRGLHGYDENGFTYLHSGAVDRVEQLKLDRLGLMTPSVDRTPVGLAVSADNIWQFAATFDPIDLKMRLIAHGAPNVLVDSSIETQIWYGELTANTALTGITISDGAVSPSQVPFKVSGGIVAVHPYLFAFGNNGSIWWSVANKPQDFDATGSGVANPTSAKIIAGRAIRGAGVPGALFWSLDTLVRASFSGGAAIWSFDELGSAFLLSPHAVAEMDGITFWPDAQGRFMMYNGAIREVPNELNQEFFFSHLNWSQRGRVYAFAQPKWGEIWYCFPKDDATECNHAIIQNVRLNTWYDTPLPNGGRSAVWAKSLLGSPIMAGVEPVLGSSKYRLWRHEVGVNEIDGSRSNAIRASVTTGDLSLMKGQQPSTAAVHVSCVEPDLIQSGDITFQIFGNANARAPTLASDIFTIREDGTEAEDQVVRPKESARQMRFALESNTLDGTFELGASFVHIEPESGGVTT